MTTRGVAARIADVTADALKSAFDAYARHGLEARDAVMLAASILVAVRRERESFEQLAQLVCEVAKTLDTSIRAHRGSGGDA